MTESALKAMKTVAETINLTELSCQMAVLTTSTGLKFMNMGYSELPYFYLYLFMDVFSRKVVGWQVYGVA